MFVRVVDRDKEPLNTPIDSDDVCFPPKMSRILKMIPVFNIIYGFWSENNIQLDTVFESLKNCDVILDHIHNVENQGKKYINSCVVNNNEELSVMPVIPLKETLVLYKKYRDEAEIVLCESDLWCIKEYFCEFVRKSCYAEKQGRLGSVFLYENLGVAAMAGKNDVRNKYGTLCEVKIVEKRVLDRHDGRWLSDIRTTCLFKECFEAIKNYWEGKMTDNPKVEYLFSGKYTLKEL